MKKALWISSRMMSAREYETLERMQRDSVEVHQYRANVNSLDQLKAAIDNADIVCSEIVDEDGFIKAAMPIDIMLAMCQVAKGKQTLVSCSKYADHGIAGRNVFKGWYEAGRIGGNKNAR